MFYELKMDFSQKTAVITGAAEGIGKAYAEALLEKGCKVCMSDINDSLGKDTCSKLQKEYGANKVIFAKCDVTSDEQVKGLFQAAVDKFQYVDIMINNAGIVREDKPDLVLDVNLKGTIRGMTAAIEHMRKDKGGHGGVIVNTASIAVFRPANFVPIYTATKWAVVGYSKSWAAHPDTLENDIRIVSICPDLVKTNLEVSEETVKGYHLFEKLRCNLKIMSSNDIGEALIKVLEDKDNNGLCLRVEKPLDVQMYYA